MRGETNDNLAVLALAKAARAAADIVAVSCGAYGNLAPCWCCDIRIAVNGVGQHHDNWSNGSIGKLISMRQRVGR